MHALRLVWASLAWPECRGHRRAGSQTENPARSLKKNKNNTVKKKFRFQSGGRSNKNEIILIQKFDMRFDLFYCKYPRTQDKLESAKLKALSTGISRWKCIEQEIFRLKRSKREGNFFVKPNL